MILPSLCTWRIGNPWSLAAAATLAAVVIAGPCGAVAQQPGPSDEHELLKKDVGTWKATMKIWPQPDAEPLVSEATETNELLGGLWLISHFEGDVAGQPFTGQGTMGYDPAEKTYVGTWIDTMNPYLTTFAGQYDPATQTMTSHATGRDPQTGQPNKSKMISRYTGDDTRTFEIHMPGPAGDYWKMMEVHYQRQEE